MEHIQKKKNEIGFKLNRGKFLTPHHMTLVTLQKGYDILGNRYPDNCIKPLLIT